MSLAIDEAALELESCNKAINELKNRLARLKKCRRNLIRRIALKGSLLSPIQTLPPEVLRLVFSYVKRPIEASSPESRRIRIRSPVFGLTWVCAHWRAIGLSERHLWDDYMVDWRSYRQFTPIFRAFLKECFEVRAQKAPVDLELVSSILTPAVTPVLDIVLKSPQRWRNIIIKSDNSNYALLDHLPLCLHGCTTFPHLETLTILVSNPYAGPQTSKVLGKMQYCPRLRDLYSSFLDLSQTCDMKHLTSLNIERFVGHSLTQLLMQCPSLEKLTLENVVKAPISNPVYHHRHLACLELDIVNSVTEMGWSTGLYLPALTQLSYFPSSTDMHKCETLHEMAGLLVRSDCSLERIELGFLQWVAEEDQIRFLEDISPVTVPGASIEIVHP